MAKELGTYLDDVLEDIGEPTTWEQANRIVQMACLRLGKDRHADYGPDNIGKFGVPGISMRLYDKLERVTTMALKDNPVAQLQTIDTILDTDSPESDEKKLQRIRSLRQSSKHQEESMEDSLGDISNYGLYGVMLERGWWNLPPSKLATSDWIEEFE